MFENVLFAAAAVATIAGVILEVWREMKSSKQEDGEGRNRKDQRYLVFSGSKQPAPPARVYSFGLCWCFHYSNPV